MSSFVEQFLIQLKNYTLDHMIHPTFRIINSLFVASFENGDTNAAKD